MNKSKEKTDVIIYRVNDKGLEVFLLPNEEQNELASIQSGISNDTISGRLAHTEVIALESYQDANGDTRNTIAIEADWHDIPSLRELMYEDYILAKAKAKDKLKSIIPDLDKGAFVAVKETVKRVMPDQYAYIKELKDIILEKNQSKSV